MKGPVWFCDVLTELMQIQSYGGQGSHAKKIAHLRDLVGRLGPDLLWFLDGNTKTTLGINKKSFQKARAQITQYRARTFEEVVSLQRQIGTIEGEKSVGKKLERLIKILEAGGQAHLSLLQAYYTKGQLAIGLNQKGYRQAVGLGGQDTLFSKSLQGTYLGDTHDAYILPMMASHKRRPDVQTSYGVEAKLDGIRVIITRKQGRLSATSRRGRPYRRAVSEAVVHLLETHGGAKDFVVDGQLWVPGSTRGDGFQKVSHLTRAQAYRPIQGLRLSLFDILEYDGVSCLQDTYRDRRARLVDLFGQSSPLLAPFLGYHLGQLLTSEYCTRLIQPEWQGLVLKAAHSTYRTDHRSLSWIKFKRSGETLDLAVTGAHRGTGKFKNLFASFELSCLHEGKLCPLGKVGTGFTEQHLLDLNEAYETAILRGDILMVQVVAQALTVSSDYGVGYSLRFPSYRRIRWDRNQPNTLDQILQIFRQ